MARCFKCLVALTLGSVLTLGPGVPSCFPPRQSFLREALAARVLSARLPENPERIEVLKEESAAQTAGAASWFNSRFWRQYLSGLETLLVFVPVLAWWIDPWVGHRLGMEEWLTFWNSPRAPLIISGIQYGMHLSRAVSLRRLSVFRERNVLETTMITGAVASLIPWLGLGHPVVLGAVVILALRHGFVGYRTSTRLSRENVTRRDGYTLNELMRELRVSVRRAPQVIISARGYTNEWGVNVEDTEEWRVSSQRHQPSEAHPWMELDEGLRRIRNWLMTHIGSPVEATEPVRERLYLLSENIPSTGYVPNIHIYFGRQQIADVLQVPRRIQRAHSYLLDIRVRRQTRELHAFLKENLQFLRPVENYYSPGDQYDFTMGDLVIRVARVEESQPGQTRLRSGYLLEGLRAGSPFLSVTADTPEKLLPYAPLLVHLIPEWRQAAKEPEPSKVLSVLKWTFGIRPPQYRDTGLLDRTRDLHALLQENLRPLGLTEILDLGGDWYAFAGKDLLIRVARREKIFSSPLRLLLGYLLEGVRGGGSFFSVRAETPEKLLPYASFLLHLIPEWQALQENPASEVSGAALSRPAPTWTLGTPPPDFNEVLARSS